MTKAKLTVLEKIFAAEIGGRLPAQIRSKHLNELEADGYVVQIERTFGKGTRFPVTCKGWALTLKGHCEYCEWAARKTEESL